MAYRLPLARAHQITTTGAPQSGAKLYVYENATTTLVALYSDRAGTVSAANPIVADSAGRFPARYIAARTVVTTVCKTSADVTLWSDDDTDPTIGASQALLASGDALTGQLKFASHGNIASAATVDLSTLAGNYAILTGTTTVTAWGTVQAGARYWLRCAAATPITHNATSAICESGASFTTAAGDELELTSLGSGNWTIFIKRASGAPLALTEGLLATVAEINRAADVSTRLIAAGAALTVTEAAHEGKIIVLDTAAGSTCTLPAATGSGGRYRFQIGTVATSNSHIVKVANASDTMVGQILVVSDDAGNTVKPFFAAGTDDTITLNRTTTGSTRKGEYVELIDMATNLWHVQGVIAATGAEATPFSATV